MAPITRICSALFIALLSGSAVARPTEPSALQAYVQARSAAAAGESDAAVAAYAAAMRAEPDNARIASRAFRAAVAAGDRTVAVEAALQLNRAGDLPADAGLLLIGHYLQTRNHAEATALVARMEKESEFAPFLPFLRGWTGLAAQDPLAADAIKGTDANGLGASLTLEQRAFIALLSGRKIEALSLLRPAAPADERTGTSRILAAATFQKLGDADMARAMVAGSSPSFLRAQKLLDAKAMLGGAIDTPTKGLAFFYARIASEMARNRVGYFAMTMGRYAGFLDPESPFVALAEAQGLAAQGEDAEALKTLQRVDAQSPYAHVALESRIAVLQRLGQAQQAVDLAAAAAEESKSVPDYMRLGDALIQMGRYQDAAATYDKALYAADTGGARQAWDLWLLKGSALERAGDWPGAEAALRKALALGPDQAAVLNLLGYALLERREKIAEATALISRAAELQPDDAAITDSLGWAQYLAGDFDKAVATLERAAMADENEPTIREHLGDAYWRAGQRVAARYAWRAAQLLAEDAAVPRLADKVDIGLTDQNEAR